MSFFTNHLRKEIINTLESFISTSSINKTYADKQWSQLNKLQALSQIEISSIKYKGEEGHLDESITLHNRGDLTINIGEWRIEAGSPDQVYIFPQNTKILPHETLSISTSGETGYSFHFNRPIWNNRGDTGKLWSDEGLLISSLSYGDSSAEKVIVSHIHFDGKERYREGDEFVEISNLSNDDVMLGGWRLEADTNKKAFTFPSDVKLEAGTSIKLFTNKVNLKPNEYSFNSAKAIWNNTSGGCRLFNYLGTEASNYQY